MTLAEAPDVPSTRSTEAHAADLLIVPEIFLRLTARLQRVEVDFTKSPIERSVVPLQ